MSFGCLIREVKNVLGRPDSVKTYSDEIWLSFFDAGIDCCFGKTQKTLTALNFFRDGVSGHTQAQVITQDGLSPGVPKIVVLQRLGDPSQSDAAWVDRDGKWHWSWIKYPSGIAFEFGHDGKADVMTLYSNESS